MAFGDVMPVRDASAGLLLLSLRMITGLITATSHHPRE